MWNVKSNAAPQRSKGCTRQRAICGWELLEGVQNTDVQSEGATAKQPLWNAYLGKLHPRRAWLLSSSCTNSAWSCGSD